MMVSPDEPPIAQHCYSTSSSSELKFIRAWHFRLLHLAWHLAPENPAPEKQCAQRH